jgi:hypothetical protein
MTTAYIDTPIPTSGPLADLVAVLAYARGITVRGARVDSVQCEWCGEPGAVTTVRVNGQPRDEVLMPVDQPEVCGVCAPPVIRRAIAEARDDAGDIVIEVAA